MIKKRDLFLKQDDGALSLYIDGASRGNPGPAGVGVVLYDGGSQILWEFGKFIGETTNNVAEYRALIEGLKKAKELGGNEVDCFLDSELVVKQLRGEYKLKNYNMQKLFDEARKAAGGFRRVSYTHVRREEDQMPRADQLVNFALDEAVRKAKWRS